jgi:hypothetical protein
LDKCNEAQGAIGIPVTMEDERTSGEEDRRWRKALQKLGLVAVRRQLQQFAKGDANDTKPSGIQTRPSNPPHQFVQAWYRKTQQKAQRTENFRAYVLAALALATVAGGIFFLIV